METNSGVPGGCISLCYFLRKKNKTINTHLFILINITDIAICFLMVFVGKFAKAYLSLPLLIAGHRVSPKFTYSISPENHFFEFPQNLLVRFSPNYVFESLHSPKITTRQQLSSENYQLHITINGYRYASFRNSQHV